MKTHVVLYSAAFWMGSTCSVLRARNGDYLFKTGDHNSFLCEPDAPDADFASSPALVELKNGKQNS